MWMLHESHYYYYADQCSFGTKCWLNNERKNCGDEIRSSSSFRNASDGKIPIDQSRWKREKAPSHIALINPQSTPWYARPPSVVVGAYFQGNSFRMELKARWKFLRKVLLGTIRCFWSRSEGCSTILRSYCCCYCFFVFRVVVSSNLEHLCYFRRRAKENIPNNYHKVCENLAVFIAFNFCKACGEHVKEVYGWN